MGLQAQTYADLSTSNFLVLCSNHFLAKDFDTHGMGGPMVRRVHKNAAKWIGKKFPHYWDLCIVFGKDRANGRDAQTIADIISDINREEPEATTDGLDDMDVNQPLNIPSNVATREES
ncbi:hypothetical protein L1987_68357 [Smallanthus sonchifolius]|uniref:Uncharacterized protein n=1 Tax=Smallanthus sonchifolius TaxID=185202 RepID=A0ACB9B5J7_9ASTR|nr:hypothetical protein L1987_68357 [Smallanthus sonchifolius]